MGGDLSYYDSLMTKLSSLPVWPEEKERVLLEPFDYLEATPGKEIRTELINAFNVWLQVPEEQLEIVRRIVRMLHTASLLMDDVEDDSQLRRGNPVAHKIYGTPQTINSANYVYFLAFQELYKLRGHGEEPSIASTSSLAADTKGQEEKEELMTNGKGLERLVVDELINLHRGQGMDLFWRDSLTCPTEEEYIAMVNNKTGGLIRIAIKLMMAKSQSSVDYVPLVNLIGVFFQIRDDYMNLQSTNYANNKGYCEDLTEGKFSFPILHSVRADPTNRQLLNVLKQRPTDVTTKSYAVSYMRHRTKSFQYTLDVLSRLYDQAEKEIERLGGNPYLSAIMDKLRVREDEEGTEDSQEYPVRDQLRGPWTVRA